MAYVAVPNPIRPKTIPNNISYAWYAGGENPLAAHHAKPKNIRMTPNIIIAKEPPTPCRLMLVVIIKPKTRIRNSVMYMIGDKIGSKLLGKGGLKSNTYKTNIRRRANTILK
jgi:hypothetical protein